MTKPKEKNYIKPSKKLKTQAEIDHQKKEYHENQIKNFIIN